MRTSRFSLAGDLHLHHTRLSPPQKASLPPEVSVRRRKMADRQGGNTTPAALHSGIREFWLR